MTTLTLVITDAGRAAIVNETNMGALPVTLTEIGVGTGTWSPTPAATALQDELKRIAAVGGLAVADDVLHVTLTDASVDEYALGEFGIYTDSGILFAIYSDPAGITDKAADSMLLIAADVILTSINPGEVTVGAAGFNNPPATETVAGVAELATQAEATAGTDDVRIMTPFTSKTAAAAYQYTADQALPTPANTGTIAQLFSWIAGVIKAITGNADWKTAPPTTLGAAAAHHANTTNPHSTTAAQVGAEPAFGAGTTSQYRRGDKSWADFSAAVRAAVLTGLSTATNAVITATDTVLSAMGKLQAQITAHSAASAPHAGHETPAGAQTKVDTLAALAVLLSSVTGANQSLAENGYQHLPGGLILQWCRVTTSSSVDVFVTFPLAFPTAALSIAIAPQIGSPCMPGFSELGATTVKIKAYNAAGSRVITVVTMIVIGY
jgi:hypothetical protein